MSADTGVAQMVSRRSLLKGALAGSFTVAFHLPVFAVNEPEQPDDDVLGKFAPNAFIRIDRSGTTTLVMPQVEMGQGVYTSIPMILAEELDADFSRVVIEHAPPSDKLYANPVFGIQVTGNSNSIRAFWMPLRSAGASARATLVQAAAARWKVSAAECSASNGRVEHSGSGRSLAYGDLVDAAAAMAPAKDVALKDPSRFALVGKPLKRLDTPNKVNGVVVYGIDAMLPGMKFATIAHCPVLGGKVRHVDDRAIKGMAGVQKVVVLDDMVAVVGDHMWAAKKGLEALRIEWDEGPNAQVSSKDLWEQIRLASANDGVVAKNVGDVDKGLAVGDRFDAAYEVPLLAHATMEPMNCTVQLQPDSCRIWLGTQVIARVQQTAAELLGMPLDKVTVHNHLIGGGFGRRLEPDMALSAVRVAQHLDGSPVKVVWTREEDVRHDIYRPLYRDVIAATMSNGTITSYKYKICGSAILARWLPPAFQKGIDIDAVDSAVDMPYDIPNFRAEYVRVEPKAVRTGFWRGVGPNNNVFAIECFMDELAKKAGKDPVAFRAAMLGKTPRLKAALELAAAKSGWGQSLPRRVGRGVSVQPSFASFIATIVEAEVDEQGEVELRRVTSVVDTGIAVNPDTIVAQIQGGLIFGLTAALYGEVTVRNGRIEQSNFNDYRMLRINQTPKIEVHVVKSGEPPGGIGEAGTTSAPPALRNAIFAATGIALRRLPIDRELLAGRKPA
ncbi:MAG: molybdopterin cofactor-binding domain-containing protein [Caldimonas sp.]